uniref:SAP domain-containing protein n=1 Tax=Dunaliella tertiolecta TaxID=3047 RepID=A0A7S3QLH8_DUNTE
MGLFSELARLLSAPHTSMALANMLGPAMLDIHRPEVAPASPAFPKSTPPSDLDGSDHAKQAFRPPIMNELPSLCIDNIVFFLLHNKTSLASIEQGHSSQSLVQWTAEARTELMENLEGLKALVSAQCTQDPDPVQISKQLTQLLGCSEARLLLHAFTKLELGMAELGNRPEPGVAPSGLAVQVIRAFREPSTQSAPPTPVADTFSAAQPETDTQAEADAQVPAAAQAEAAAQAAAEQGAAVDDAVHTAALVEDVLAMELRPKRDIVQDVIALAAVSKPQEDLCYKVARSIALLIDPPSPYECLLGRLSDEQDAADAFAKGIPANGANKPKVLQLKAACKESGLAVSGTYAQLCSRLKQHEDQNSRHAGSFGAGLRSSTIDSAKKERHQKKMQAAARHRREQLQQALEARRPWLVIRSDSQMCRSYIYDKPLGRDKRVPPLDEVVDSVETMDFLYNKTDYAHQLREARRADHDSGEEEDSEEEELMEADRREGAKYCSVLGWVYRHAAEEIPTLPRALHSIAWECHERKIKELNSKKHSDHNKGKQC